MYNVISNFDELFGLALLSIISRKVSSLFHMKYIAHKIEQKIKMTDSKSQQTVILTDEKYANGKLLFFYHWSDQQMRNVQ